MTSHRKVLGFATFLTVVGLVLTCLYLARSGVAPTADLTGHWAGPQGGLALDASSDHLFQLDIMHTFSFGTWKATSADSCSLQFYDLSAETPVFDDAALLGSAKLRREGDQVFCELTMPDGATGTFHHTGPPMESLKDLKFD